MALIELEKITKTFRMGDQELHALAEVSLGISQGDHLAIMGPSGCGKSTLMNILGLLDRPTTGEYRIDGRPTADLGDNELAHLRNRKIGFIFQTFNLLPRYSALRNVEMPLIYSASHDPGWTRSGIRAKARAALARVGLTDRAEHGPQELSGGQRQRVAIARAVVNRPDLLLADEPTGALDSRTGAEILDLFDELNRDGMTLVVVTHDASVAARARRIIRMLDGRIIKEETVAGH